METCTFSVINNNNNNINNNNNHHLFITFENNVGFKIGSWSKTVKTTNQYLTTGAAAKLLHTVI